MELKLPINWKPGAGTKTAADLIPFIETPTNREGMKQLNTWNNQVIAELEQCDATEVKSKYLPPKDPSVRDSRKKKKKLKTYHVMLVMAMRGNPHLGEKNKKKREKIIKSIMVQK